MLGCLFRCMLRQIDHLCFAFEAPGEVYCLVLLALQAAAIRLSTEAAHYYQ